MDLGIDIGTSAVKVVLVDADDRLVDQESQPLAVSRPQPLWSEQDPEAWWRATEAAVAALRGRQAKAMAAVRGIGLSGQMHGATLLDAAGRVLRPAILWNDGRSGAECVELERRAPDLPRITGNRAMAGFTAPKLLWVKRHDAAADRRGGVRDVGFGRHVVARRREAALVAGDAGRHRPAGLGNADVA